MLERSAGLPQRAAKISRDGFGYTLLSHGPFGTMDYQ
jgi:hypothetical protein